MSWGSTTGRSSPCENGCVNTKLRPGKQVKQKSRARARSTSSMLQLRDCIFQYLALLMTFRSPGRCRP